MKGRWPDKNLLQLVFAKQSKAKDCSQTSSIILGNLKEKDHEREQTMEHIWGAIEVFPIDKCVTIVSQSHNRLRNFRR